ncbi:LOW protein: protein BOBBER-like protein [Hirschfeldia incana]|nr:LOW protein: protein BOBBER-like protein [Hirschfeldia incana]
MATKENQPQVQNNKHLIILSVLSLRTCFCNTLQYHEMRTATSLLTFNQKIVQHCKKLLIRLASSGPKRHYRHLKLNKASSSSAASASSSGKKATRVVSSFFLTFQKKKQKKEKMNRLNELGSFSDSVCDKKAESRKKAFPSSLKTSCISQGKAHSQKVSQDLDAPRDSTSAFLP